MALPAAPRPLARRIAARALPRAVVLCYHRISEPDSDPQGLAVSPANFRSHLEVLDSYRVVTVGEIATAASRRVPHRAVAISLDDGYADNLTAAAPLLEASGKPATVFVASDWIDTGGPAWWDELDLMFHRDHPGPDPAYGTLLEKLAGVDPAERKRTLAELRGRLGEPDPRRAAARRALTVAELAELAALPGIEIGAHTRAHPALSQRPASEQRDEIEGGREDLAELTGTSPRLFAYPFGAWGRHYDRTTADAVASAGFTAAFATDPGPISALGSRFMLSRILVGDLDGDAFSRRLRRAFWI